jgi:hypothetical protein
MLIIFFLTFSILLCFFLTKKRKFTKIEACPRKSKVQVGPGMNAVSNVGSAEEKQKKFLLLD